MMLLKLFFALVINLYWVPSLAAKPKPMCHISFEVSDLYRDKFVQTRDESQSIETIIKNNFPLLKAKYLSFESSLSLYKILLKDLDPTFASDIQWLEQKTKYTPVLNLRLKPKSLAPFTWNKSPFEAIVWKAPYINKPSDLLIAMMKMKTLILNQRFEQDRAFFSWSASRELERQRMKQLLDAILLDSLSWEKLDIDYSTKSKISWGDRIRSLLESHLLAIHWLDFIARDFFSKKILSPYLQAQKQKRWDFVLNFLETGYYEIHKTESLPQKLGANIQIALQKTKKILSYTIMVSLIHVGVSLKQSESYFHENMRFEDNLAPQAHLVFKRALEDNINKSPEESLAELSKLLESMPPSLQKNIKQLIQEHEIESSPLPEIPTGSNE